MASVQTVWGLDMGRCALKALKLRIAGDGKVEFLAKDYVEHAKILSQPDANRGELIGRALETFLSRNDISKDLVVVGVPGQQTLARFTKLPPVAAKRIPDIVRYEADQQIPFDMDEVIWDYQTFQEKDSPDLEVGIFAMKRELIREHLLHFEQASIEPIAVQSGPLAIYNAAHFDGLLSDDTTILLDVGAENTDLIIATSESFWTRTVSIGGNKFTEALVKSFKLSFAKAEGLKRTADSSKYARQIFQAMRPVFADLVQELQRSIGFYSATHRDTDVKKVVCFGNAFLLPGLKKYLQQNLGLPVESPSSFEMAVPSAVTADPEFKEQLLSFAAAYGLALQGADLAKVTSSLLPTEIAKQVVWRKKRPAFAAAAACILIAGGLVWFRQFTDMRALAASDTNSSLVIRDRQHATSIIENGPPGATGFDRAKAILAAGSFLKKELKALGSGGNDEREETEAVIQLQDNKTVIPQIIQAIHESVPPSVFAGAESQADILRMIQAGEVPPRGKRDQVNIIGIEMRWEDVNYIEWECLVEGPEPDNDPNQALDAIKIEITCTTPNQEGLGYISEGLVAALRKNGRQESRGFYFDRVCVFDARKLETGDTIARARGAETDSAPSPEKLDVLTNEVLVDDWQFEIWIDAVLEDLPESAIGEDEADESTGD